MTKAQATGDEAEHLAKLLRILNAQGVVALLRQLNARTPYRFTSIYRYDPPTLRNVYVVDAYAPEVTRGSDVAMVDAYCVFVSANQPTLEFTDPAGDARVTVLANSPVSSYCGALLKTLDGTAFGTVCHHDIERCQKNGTELSVLAALAPAIMAKLLEEGAAAPLPPASSSSSQP